MSKQTKRGFTVTEVLVAITLFSFIIIPVIHMFVASMQQTVYGEDYLQATLLAQQEIEEVKYSATLSKTSLKDLAGQLSGERKSPDGRYRIATRIDPDAKAKAKSAKGEVKAKLAEVTVTVKWNDEAGKEHEMTLATLVDGVRY